MPVDLLLDRFREAAGKDAIVWRDRTFSYAWLRSEIERWSGRLEAEGVERGATVGLEADFSPRAVALFFALAARRCVIVPLTLSVEAQKPRFREIAEVEVRILIDGADVRFHRTGASANHELLTTLRDRDHPGLVFFTSGSTGEPKAALHDLVPLLEKFKVQRHSKRTIAFLLFDHIGGINTLLYVLSNGGCAITLEDRSPESVCATIERHRAQILPTSPTFLNLLLLAEAYETHDLSSLELVTYGTEVMPESTLRRFHALFPDLRLLQTYGLTETGILRSKSRSSDSLWVKVGGEGFETRVVDGLLEIRAESAMLGYLNAESPFTDDGWLRTGDAVEVDGEYVRFLGRDSDVINVGGEKVYPSEVEGVLQEMSGVVDVTVTGEPNPLTGQMVTAHLHLSRGEGLAEFRKRLHAHCRDRLPRFKIPQKVTLVDHAMHGERFKKIRRAPSPMSSALRTSST
jgi:acyl-CoA synthetase (AMP-forming)/AMP-acid ligase II